MMRKERRSIVFEKHPKGRRGQQRKVLKGAAAKSKGVRFWEARVANGIDA